MVFRGRRGTPSGELSGELASKVFFLEQQLDLCFRSQEVEKKTNRELIKIHGIARGSCM